MKTKVKRKLYCSSQKVGKPDWSFLLENSGNLWEPVLSKGSRLLFSRYFLSAYCWNISLCTWACFIGWLPFIQNLVCLMGKFTIAFIRFRGLWASSVSQNLPASPPFILIVYSFNSFFCLLVLFYFDSAMVSVLPSWHFTIVNLGRVPVNCYL